MQNNPILYWCHLCKVQFPLDSPVLLCPQCQQEFVEKIDPANHP